MPSSAVTTDGNTIGAQLGATPSLVLCIDLEQDEPAPRGDVALSNWHGVSAAFAWSQQLRQRLPDARLNWFVRADRQVRDVLGSATWAFDAFSTELAVAGDIGDAIGMHPHSWQRVGDGWVNSADPATAAIELGVAATSFAERFGEQCTVVRLGDRVRVDDSVLVANGVRFDLTAEPGKPSEACYWDGDGTLPSSVGDPTNPHCNDARDLVSWPLSTIDFRRVGTRRPDHRSTMVNGYFDGVDDEWVAGWAVASDGGPVAIRLLVDGRQVAETAACFRRADLAQLGVDGRVGFRIPTSDDWRDVSVAHFVVLANNAVLPALGFDARTSGRTTSAVTTLPFGVDDAFVEEAVDVLIADGARTITSAVRSHQFLDARFRAALSDSIVRLVDRGVVSSPAAIHQAVAQIQNFC